MKKVLSVILSLLMIFAVMAPAVSAANEKTVTIYVEGYGDGLYGKSGEQAFPVDLGLVDKIKEMLFDLLSDLAWAKLTGDYSAYSDGLYELIAPAYADLKLDNNGEATDENGNPYFGLGFDPLERTEFNGGRFSNGYYRFRYDWRLSVEYNAGLLEQYIDKIVGMTGATKVNLIGRCLGGNIVSAFLQNASATSIARLDKVVMYIPSTLGVEFISALFSGKIVLDSDAIDNYVNYSLADNDILGLSEDDPLLETLTTIIDFVNQIYVLGYGADVVEDIVQSVKDDALSRILRDSYASFPSFWSMVCPDDLEDAIALVYNTPELQKEYSGMIDKIRSYHYNVQLNADDRMLELEKKGIEIMVISKYNYADFPLSADAAQQSDGTAATVSTSFGATIADFGTTFSDSYIKAMDKNAVRYLSADKMIDASTCTLPDTTWFIKNCYHSVFPQCVDNLIDAFITGEDMTIETYERYSQYLKYDSDNDTLSKVTGIDDGDIIDRDSTTAKTSVFIKMLIMILNIFKKIFGEGIKLPSIGA